MKTFSILMVCLILGMSLQQQAVTPTCSLTDANNNNKVVLNWLQAKGVKINGAPDKTVAAEVCNGEFSTNGSCCELASLKTFIASINSGLVTKWKNYIGRIARIKAKLVSGFNKIAAKMNVQDITNKLNAVKANQKIANKFANAGAVMPATVEDIANLKTFFTNFNENVQTFKTKGKLCFDAMKAARANLFCAACSGRATGITDVQTSTSANFKIDQTSCNILVNQCFGIWKFNFYITSMMQYVNVNLAKKKGDSADNAFKTQRQVSATDLEDLKVTFRSCAYATADATLLTCNTTLTNGKTAQDLTNTLCTKQFSVNYQNSYLEGDETVDAGVTDDEVANADADIETPKRILQAAESTVDVGVAVTTTGDTYVNMNSASSTVVPTESVTTSTAGDSTTSSAASIVQAAIALLAVVYLF